jgi:hypothetical protein
LKQNWFALWVGLFVCIGLFFQNCSSGGMEVASPEGKGEEAPFSIDNPNSKPTCQFNGSRVEEGESVTAFLNSTPEFTNSCLSETRTCKDGALSGTYTYASCRQGPKACLFNGITLESGQSITAYNASSTATCASENRICNDGRLSGSFQYTTCSPNQCLFKDRVIQAGETFKYYLNASDKNCQAMTGRCLNGGFLVDMASKPLNVSTIYASCSIAKATCNFRDQTLTEGQVFSYYLTNDLTCSDKMGYCTNTGALRDKTTDAIITGPFGDPSSCKACQAQGGAPQMDGRCFKSICNSVNECRKSYPYMIDGQPPVGTNNASQLCKEAGYGYGNFNTDVTYTNCSSTFPATSYLSGRWQVIQKPYCQQYFEGPISKVLCDVSQTVTGGVASTSCMFQGRILAFGEEFDYYTQPYNRFYCSQQKGFCGPNGKLFNYNTLAELNEVAIYPSCYADYGDYN